MKTIAALTSAQAICCLLLAVVANAEQHQQKRIFPALQPVSDKKFMKQDYPDDRRAKVFHKFEYPYPTIQDHEDYDKDYVQDKNDDNGYWAAQMEYDRLKGLLQKEMDEMKKALRALEKEKKELEEAMKREAQAEKTAALAEAKEKEADAAHGKAQADLEKGNGEIDGAVDKVNAEVTDLEECKRQLKEARAKLKILLDEKSKAEAAKKEKDKSEEGAEQKEVAAEILEAAAEKTLAEAKKEHGDAQAAFERELADVKAAEHALAKQAGVLRMFAKDEADPGGGVYDLKKGSSAMAGLSTTLLAIAGLQFL